MISYNDEYIQRIEDTLNDDDFAAKARNAKTKEELTALFAGKGIETEEAMVEAMLNKLNGINNGEELTESELMLVAGGRSRHTFRRLVYTLASGGIIVAAASTGNPIVIALGI